MCFYSEWKTASINEHFNGAGSESEEHPTGKTGKHTLGAMSFILKVRSVVKTH